MEKLLVHGNITAQSGEKFAQDLLTLENKGAKEVLVSINSWGGSVVGAFSIFSAIQNSSIKVITQNDGIAYSSASWILLSGKEIRVNDYSQVMIHNAEASDKQLAEMMTNSIATILSQKTGNELEVIKNMMSKETFMDVSQMIENKFISETQVIRTKKAQLLKNCLTPEEKFEVSNSFLYPKVNKMQKLAMILGVSNDASEDLLAEKLTANMSKINDLQAQINDLQAKNEMLEATIKTEKNAKAVELVENAVKAGKVKDEGKAQWIEIATNNFEMAKASLEAIQVGKKAVHVEFSTNENEFLSGKYEGWNIRDFEEKDPKAIERMPEALRKKLTKEFYGVEE